MEENLKKHRIVAIIQARMGSTRLPGKVLKKIGNKTIIEIIIDRLKRSNLIDQIIVATSKNHLDDYLVKYLEKRGIKYYRGDEENVLNRYVEASQKLKADIIVRVTADNPLTSPNIMDILIKSHIRKKADYTFSSNISLGIGVEVINSKILEEINKIALDPESREHVTYYFKLYPKKFKINNVKLKDKIDHLRLTVDTEADLNLMRKIYNEFGDFKNLSYIEVKDYLERNPELIKINEHINQKIPGEDIKPQITVIIRTYNSEKYLQKALDSVLNQTIPSYLYEILIIDDGSNDTTKQILNIYKKGHKQIRTFFQEHRGAIKALNTGIRESFGKYLIILDSDDEFKPEILEKMYQTAIEENADYVYCDYYEKFEGGDLKKISLKDNIFNALASGILIEKRIFDNIGYYDEDLILPEYDMLIKLTEKYEGVHIPRPMFLYKRRKESMTGNKDLVRKAISQLEEKYKIKLPIRNY